MIRLVFDNKLVASISIEELRVLARKYNKRLPYKVILETDNERDIARLRRLRIPFKLEWAGKWS